MIREQDLRIDVYRSGVGMLLGPDVPTVAVRITHIPSGLQGTGEHRSSARLAKDCALEELYDKFADRYCPKHYDPDSSYNLRLFGYRHLRCAECEVEDHQAWVEDVHQRLEFALAAATHDMTVTWRPSEDTPETLVARMMELTNAPKTLAETTAWVKNYLRKEDKEHH